MKGIAFGLVISMLFYSYQVSIVQTLNLCDPKAQCSQLLDINTKPQFSIVGCKTFPQKHDFINRKEINLTGVVV